MSELVKNLSEQRARAWEQAKNLLDHASTEARDLSAEEGAEFDRINADLDATDQRIKSILDAEKRNADIEESRSRLGVAASIVAPETAAEPGDDETVRRLMTGEIRSARFDKRAITSSNSGGSVPTSVYDRIVEHLVMANVVRNVATVVTTNGGETLNVPTSTAFSTASIVGEAAQASPSDPTLATRALGAYKYVVLVQLSNELANDGAVDVAGFLARQAGTAIGVATRGHMTTGATGGSNPVGIVTSSSAGATGATGVTGAFTGDKLIDLRYSVGSAYTSQPGVGWMMNNTAMAAARKLKGTANDHYLFAPGMNGDPDSLLGFPVYLNDSMASPALSAKSVLFGHLPSYFVREVNGIDVAVSDDFAFDYSVRTFRVTLRTDGLLVDQTGAVKHFVGGAS